jgi:hypothetical protein
MGNQTQPSGAPHTGTIAREALQIRMWRERALHAEQRLIELGAAEEPTADDIKAYRKRTGNSDPGPPSFITEKLRSKAMKGAEVWSKSIPVKFGDSRTIQYPWLAENHAGPALRTALGLKSSAFRALCRRVEINPRETAGHPASYSPAEALRLLGARLARKRPPREERTVIAEKIWRRIRSHGGAQCNKLRKVLMDAGATCADDSTPSTAVTPGPR